MQRDRMSFFEHLEVLRWVLLKSLLAFTLGCAIVGVFLPQIADILAWPLMRMNDSHPGVLKGLVTNTPMGVFVVLIQVCGLGGTALALPFILYFTIGFVAPALTVQERRVLWPGCIASFLLFVAGALFAYFLLLPTSLTVAAKLNGLLGFELIWSASRYYGLVLGMLIGVGLSCEFPLVVLLLISLDIVSTARLRALRRTVLVIALLAAALITPTGDPLTLVLLAAPLYGLYEGSLWLGGRIERRKSRMVSKPCV